MAYLIKSTIKAVIIHASILLPKFSESFLIWVNAGIEDFRVHDFRHTCASRLVQNGMTVQETAHILGHSNIATTMRYAHLEKNQVAEKMKAVIDRFNDL